MPALPKSLKDFQKNGPPLTEQLVAWLMGCAAGCLVFGALAFGFVLVCFGVGMAVSNFDTAYKAGTAWGVGLALVFAPLVAGAVMFMAVGVAEKRVDDLPIPGLGPTE